MKVQQTRSRASTVEGVIQQGLRSVNSVWTVVAGLGLTATAASTVVLSLPTWVFVLAMAVAVVAIVFEGSHQLLVLTDEFVDERDEASSVASAPVAGFHLSGIQVWGNGGDGIRIITDRPPEGDRP